MNLDSEILLDLAPINWSEFETSLLSPGEIYFKPSKNAKALRILKVGDLVDNQFLGKYQLVKDQIFIKQTTDSATMLFNEFIGGNLKLNRKERLARKESFIKIFFTEIWLETDQENFEKYIYTCFNTFSSFERSILFEIEGKNQLLFRRAMVISAMGIFMAHCMDCNDYSFMKEFYNSLFCLDVGLLFPKADYHLLTALKKQRENSGAGIRYLKDRKVNESTIKQYLDHGNKSIDVIEHTWDLTFDENKIYKMVKYHHLAPYQKKTPNEINYKQLFHWEEVGYFLDQWIPFDKDCFDLEKIQNEFYKQNDKSICYEYLIKWQDLIQLRMVG